jgi:hypothetical protein
MEMTTMIRILTARFKQLRGLFKQRWGELTNDPRRLVEGRKESLAGVLLLYGYSLEGAYRESERFFASASERKEQTGPATTRYSCRRG